MSPIPLRAKTTSELWTRVMTLGLELLGSRVDDPFHRAAEGEAKARN